MFSSDHNRGVGCIFFEMASGRPLFPGSTVEDQLQLIFSLLGIYHLSLSLEGIVELIGPIFLRLLRAGTPTEETWPGIQNNEDFLSYRFDHYAPQSLIHRAPRLDGDGLDLLNKFLGVRSLPPLISFFIPHESAACTALNLKLVY